VDGFVHHLLLIPHLTGSHSLLPINGKLLLTPEIPLNTLGTDASTLIEAQGLSLDNGAFGPVKVLLHYLTKASKAHDLLVLAFRDGL
jgi:hypothetical protein